MYKITLVCVNLSHLSPIPTLLFFDFVEGPSRRHPDTATARAQARGMIVFYRAVTLPKNLNDVVQYYKEI